MAARKFLVPINLGQNELQNAVIQNLGTAPGSPSAGQVYYDTAANTLYFRGSSAWINTNPASLLGTANTWTSTNAFNGAITGNNTINLTGTGASSVGGTFTGTAIVASGLTGATSASRYVGGTTSGAPASGTFSVGDYVVAQNGAIWVCTTGGTPGTWTQIGATPTLYYQTVKVNNVGVTQRSVMNFISGTYTTATVVDNASQTDVKFDVSVGSPTAETSYGLSSAAGTATSLARSDHTHGSPSLTSVTPSTQAIGDTAVVGTGTAPAREDHKHAMPSFGAVSAQTSFGASSGNGSATTIARSDHTHGTPTHDAAAHSGISLSAFSAPTADLSAGNFKITNLATPVSATDAATKGYVDATATGLDVKQSVRVASTATVTVTYNATSGTSGRGQITAAPNTLDGVTLAANDRILLKNQSTGAQNGIWVVTTLGTGANGVWDRATDFDADAEVTSGAFTFVEEGTTNADTGWVLTTNNPIVIGGASGTSLTFAQFSGAGAYTAGNGLTQSGTTFNVGAGTGIVVNADDVAVNRTGTNNAHVPLLYTTATHASSTTIPITHGLNNQYVLAQVYEVATNALVDVDIVQTSATVTTFNFATAPAANTYRFVIYG